MQPPAPDRRNPLSQSAPQHSQRSATANTVIAMNRFAQGARPGDLIHAQENPQHWLETQLSLPQFSTGLLSSTQAITQYFHYRELQDQLKQKTDKNKIKTGNEINIPEALKPRNQLNNFVNDSLKHAINADNSLAWRCLDFFSNHFSVSTSGGAMTYLAPTLEREAIAPHLFGNFADMLIAVETHPAMLIYLNNEKSFGPNSKIGKHHKDKGLNENLAREILELHTLGVGSGYQQADVIELAKAISGWSLARPKETEIPAGFIFRERGHEPGARRVLGKTYAQTGQDQGEKILRDLAIDPATAKHLSFKLARHFLSDNPPASLIDRLTQRWLATHGNLREWILTLINSPEAWQPEPHKYKTPREFVISACRACGINSWKHNQALKSLIALGQQPFNAGSPAGFGDVAADWDGSDALQARIEWTAQLAQVARITPKAIIENSFAGNLSNNTLKTVQRAESEYQARILLLLSPEFLRR